MSFPSRRPDVRALILLGLAACSVRDPVAIERGDGGTQDRETYCMGSGPPILVGDGMGRVNVCSGMIAQTSFRFAVCTCADYVTSFSLFSDSFASSQGPYQPGGRGGAAGITGAFQSN